MDTKTSENISTTTLSRTDLVECLRNGAMAITFTKKDGSERVMKCTLMETVVVPHERKTDRVIERTDNNLPVWDIEADAWRSINIDTIKEVVVL